MQALLSPPRLDQTNPNLHLDTLYPVRNDKLQCDYTALGPTRFARLGPHLISLALQQLPDLRVLHFQREILLGKGWGRGQRGEGGGEGKSLKLPLLLATQLRPQCAWAGAYPVFAQLFARRTRSAARSGVFSCALRDPVLRSRSVGALSKGRVALSWQTGAVSQWPFFVKTLHRFFPETPGSSQRSDAHSCLSWRRFMGCKGRDMKGRICLFRT